MILYFSGTGNSAYAAKKLGNALKETPLDLFEKIRSHDYSPLYSDTPWVIAAPTYAWRIPRILEDWIKKTPLNGSSNIYFIMTCGGSIGNAEHYVKKLCAPKGLHVLGCIQVVMPENYIAMFSTPSEEEAISVIRKADTFMEPIPDLIQAKASVSPLPITLGDRLNSGIVNDLFYPLFVHSKKFHATSACISCGKCVQVCPLKNVRLEQGMPVWGKECTHCMACICRCPKEAIEYGSHSKGLPRYTFPENHISQ